MPKKPKSTLSAKAQKAAAPTTTHPVSLKRKYADPVPMATLKAARDKILHDLLECLDIAERIGSIGDRIRINEARELAHAINPATELPWALSVVIDEHTGTKYEVELTLR